MSGNPQDQTDRPVVDWAAVLDRFGGDEDLLKEIIGIYLEEYPTLVAGIRRALASADARGLETAAHTLKGSVSTFGARSATQVALELEMAGRSRDLTGVSGLADQLDVELAVVDQVLREAAARGN